MSNRRPKGRELIRRPNKLIERSEESELSTFGAALALAFGGVLFAFSPLLLNLAPASLPSDFLISVALALLLWAVLGIVDEVGKIKGAFQHEGWSDLFTTLILALPPTILFGLVLVLDLSSFVELPLTVLSLLLCLPLCLGVGATVDAFLIRPRLQPPPSRAQRRQGAAPTSPGNVSMLGIMAAIVTWILSNVASFLTIVEQLFSNS